MSLPRRSRSRATASFAGFTSANTETIIKRLGRDVDPVEARRFVWRLQANVDRTLRLPWLDRRSTAITALAADADRDAMRAVAEAAHELRLALDRLHRPDHSEALLVLRGEWSPDVPWARPVVDELEDLSEALAGTSGRAQHRPKDRGVVALLVQALAFAWLDTWGTAPPAKGPSTRFAGLVSTVLEILNQSAPHLANVLRDAPHHTVITRLVDESTAAYREGASFDPAVFLTR